MATLTDYLTDVTNILNDPLYQFYSQTNLTRWINQARKRIAKESQCIRVLTPSSASVENPITVTAGGTGYTSATVTFSDPDAFGTGFITATGTATLLAGAVTAITLTDAGTGYVNAPTITIDGDGTGATATCTIGDYMQTVASQEKYMFSTANAIVLANEPGVQRAIGLQSVAISWGSTKPVLKYTDWSSMQAYMRSVNYATTAYPIYWSQYGQGANGSIYVWPIPSQSNQMEWDCFCEPIDLVDDTTIEAIPDPWTEAVQWLAAYWAYSNAQRRDDAQYAVGEYKRFLRENRTYVTPSMVVDFYPEY